MCAPAPVLVDVLGHVCEMREVAERAYHLEHLARLQVEQQLVERRTDRAALRAIGAMECHGRLADGFDPGESRRAGAIAHDVAEQASEETNVLAQRVFLVRRIVGLHGHFAVFMRMN